MTGKPTSEKAKRQADWAFLASFHEARLADLIEHVRAGFVQYDADEIDAFGLLQGSGKDSRFVTLRAPAAAERPAVKQLVKKAFKLAAATGKS